MENMSCSLMNQKKTVALIWVLSRWKFYAASLAACTCITLRMYAERKKWNLMEVKTRVTLIGNAEKNITNIKREIELIGDLSHEQRERLLYVANHCPVHKILSNPIEIETKLS